MKKSVAIAAALLFSLTLAACGSSAATTENETTSQEKTEATAEVTEETQSETSEAAAPKRDLPARDYQEVGEGTLYLVNQSGSTENGDEIVVYPDMDTWPHGFVEYQLWDLDGSVLTYIYLDGVQMDKQQVGAGYQGILDFMEDWQVTPGEHVIETVQYADNDTAGEMVFYRSETFTVKEA